jgi:hypothetical protein
MDMEQFCSHKVETCGLSDINKYMSAKLKKKSIPKVVKDLAWDKWVGADVARTVCLCCGIKEIKMNSFHCGHVIAETNGGPTTVDNLRPICAACNLSMGSENLEEFKARCGFGISTTKIQQLLATKTLIVCPSVNSLFGHELYSCVGNCLVNFMTHCRICGHHYKNLQGTHPCPCTQ